jgi:hypothetical protein
VRAARATWSPSAWRVSRHVTPLFQANTRRDESQLCVCRPHQCLWGAMHLQPAVTVRLSRPDSTPQVLKPTPQTCEYLVHIPRTPSDDGHVHRHVSGAGVFSACNNSVRRRKCVCRCGPRYDGQYRSQDAMRSTRGSAPFAQLQDTTQPHQPDGTGIGIGGDAPLSLPPIAPSPPLAQTISTWPTRQPLQLRSLSSFTHGLMSLAPWVHQHDIVK